MRKGIAAGVGLVTEIRPARAVFESFREEFAEAVDRIARMLGAD